MRNAAAKALGQIRDPRATKGLLAALGDRVIDVRRSAAAALLDMRDPRAVDDLAARLRDKRLDVRRTAGKVLRAIDTQKAWNALASAPHLLADWQLGPLVAEAMAKRGKKPTKPDEEIYWWVARRQRAELLKNWPRTRKVLLRDLDSGSLGAAENALLALVSLGREEMIPVLLTWLAQKGSADMARAYLNCGHDQLRKAAIKWAKAHGYWVMSFPGKSGSVSWGGM